MISTQEIRDKEIINILDGKSLGYVSDIEINLERGRVEALIVPAQRGLFGMFSGADEYVIKWKDIKKIGEDVILAEVREASAFEDLRSSGKAERYRDYRGRNRFYDDDADLDEDELGKPARKPEPPFYRSESDSDRQGSASYRQGSAPYHSESTPYRPEQRSYGSEPTPYRVEPPSYRTEQESAKKESAPSWSSQKRQEKEGFFRARIKNTEAQDEGSEIRIRLKDEDTNMDEY